MVSTRRSSLVSVILLSLALAGGLVGCMARPDPETAAAEGRSLAPIAVRAPGPLRMVGDAFTDVPLEPAQRRALTTMMDETSARHAAIGRAMHDAAELLAGQIEAGKIDRTAMRPRIDAITDAMARTQRPDREAIERVHAMLDIEQRQYLADAVEERVETASDVERLRDKWWLWKRELALTEAQQEAIAHDVIARVGWTWGWTWGHETPGHDMLQDFPEDDFSLDETAPPLDVHALVATRAGRVLDIVEAALPHLTKAQRATAARLIRARGDTDVP